VDTAGARTIAEHVVEGSRGQRRVAEAHGVYFEHAQVEERHGLHVVPDVELLLLLGGVQAVGVAVFVNVEGHDHVGVEWLL